MKSGAVPSVQSPYVKAWREFKDSPEYKGLIEPYGLSMPRHCQQYLENRILTAFEAGYRAKSREF